MATPLGAEAFLGSLQPESHCSAMRTLPVLLWMVEFGGGQPLETGRGPEHEHSWQGVIFQHLGSQPRWASLMPALGDSCWARPPKLVTAVFAPAQSGTEETQCGLRGFSRGL